MRFGGTIARSLAARPHAGIKQFGKIAMRVAAGLLVAVPLCAPSVAWSQAPAPKAAPAAAPAPAAAAAPAAAPARAAAAPTQPARAACNNPNALGVGRTVEIDTTGGPG